MNGLAARATIDRKMYRMLARGYRLRLIEAVERCEKEVPPKPWGYDTPMLVDPLERRRAWRLCLRSFKRQIETLRSGTTALTQAIVNAHAAAEALRLALNTPENKRPA